MDPVLVTGLLIVLVILVLISIAIPIALILEIFGWTWTGVPYVPVPSDALKKLPGVLALTDRSIVYDLGCGDGRVLFMLAKQVNAQFIGVEKAPLPYMLAKLRSLMFRKKNVRIVYGDIYAAPISSATHIFTYLFSSVMDKLLPKMEQELSPGTTVVSCDFKFKNKEASQELPLGEVREATLSMCTRFSIDSFQKSATMSTSRP